MHIRVFLVEDQPAVRRGLELLLNNEPEVEVCGQAGQEDVALAQMLELKPDLAIVDLNLKRGSGLDLIRELRASSPRPRILVFSMHNHAARVGAAMRQGADGYLAKDKGSEDLIEAVRTVMAGETFLSY